MKIFWDDEEIKILSQFNNVGLKTSLKELEEKTGISEQEIEKKLKKSVRLGTIIKHHSDYRLLPLVPGIFELYFIKREDSKENFHKVAKIYRYIFKNRTPNLEYVDKIRKG